jgi:adenylate kinase family enzyme
MKIFVLGTSGAGKTPFAEAIAKASGLTHVKASGWVREKFPREKYASREEHISMMTCYSTVVLANNPMACVEYIRSSYDLSEECVIEGIRNPFDFAHLFDPKYDEVVFLKYARNNLPLTVFEEGLEVIGHYLRYLMRANIMNRWRYHEYTFDHFLSRDCNSKETSLEEVFERFKMRMLW